MSVPVSAVIPAMLFALFVPAGAARAEVDYLKQVKPILASRCYACHGALKQKNGLRLDTAALLLKGGKHGPAAVAGDPDHSRILRAVSGGGGGVEAMPADGTPLTTEQVALLRAWIAEGAKAPADEAPQADPRDFWSLKPPVRPNVPAVKDSRWSHNPIDAFVAAEQERRGLVPMPEAERHVLLRRVYLDLTGLPPTRDELHDFLNDQSPDAYEKVVDRLLASPRYGERWGRHWMDVWRYSDWAGYQQEVRNSQPHVWRWRDWIVESLNADKPYDRMVREMLAGDEIAPDDPDTVRATGFLVRNWYKFNRNVWLDDTVEHTFKAFLATTINCARCHDHRYDPISQPDFYRAKAIFEPHDVRTDPVNGEPDTKKDGVVQAYDAKADAKTFLFVRGDEKRPDESEPLGPGVPMSIGGAFAVEPVTLPPTAYYPGLRPAAREEARARTTAAVQQAREELAKAEAALSPSPLSTGARGNCDTPSPELVVSAKLAADAAAAARANLLAAEAERVATDARLAADAAKYADPPATDASVLSLNAAQAERRSAVLRAEAGVISGERDVAAAILAAKVADAKTKKAIDEKQKQLAERRKQLDAALAAVREKWQDANYSPFGPVYPAASTGRRLALARWITDRNNPLAARVAVNHVWMRHFGEPLVPTVFEFGHNGQPPTHPDLLDWLAVEFVQPSVPALSERSESKWSMKHLHRLIVTSETYRMASAPLSDADRAAADRDRAIDPDNRYLWRANPRRLEAEAVRDSLLYVAGRLDFTMGGPELPQDDALKTNRRSLYYRHAHEKQAEFLKIFDAASPAECYRRPQSVVPQQALALANSPLAIAQARLIASALTKEVGDGADEATARAFLDAAFEQVLGRPPTDAERQTCTRFLNEQARRLADPTALQVFGGDAAPVKPADDPRQRARESLVHVLLNHGDFVTIR